MPADLALVESAARLSLFADLGHEELGSASPHARGLVRRGEWVVRRGQVDVGLHVIVDGEAGSS